MAKRANVPISVEHDERLKELAGAERRSKTGQVEYMIDNWPVLSRLRQQRFQNALSQTYEASVEQTVQQMSSAGEKLYLSEIVKRMNGGAKSEDNATSGYTSHGIGVILRQLGYEIFRDDDGKAFIEMNLSDALVLS